MILNIDLNPRMNIYYNTKKININRYNENGKFSFYPAGDAFTISKLLSIFSEDVMMTGFLGGLWEAEYLKVLDENSIKFDYIKVKDGIATDLKVEDESENVLSISEGYKKIVSEEVVDFYNNFDKLAESANVIVGSGDYYPDLGEIIYYNLTKVSGSKKTILNLRGGSLVEAIKANPHMIVLDKEALETYVNLLLLTKEDVINACNYILNGEIEVLVVNIGSEYIYMDKEGYNTVSYKDNTLTSKSNLGIVAGMALGLNRNYEKEMTLRLAEAFNHIIRTNSSLKKVDLADIKYAMNNVEII